MPYRYLEHEADIGLEASGADVAEALEAGVQGMLELMARTDSVRPEAQTPVEAEGWDFGALFVSLLNAVIAARDISGHFFHSFKLDALERDGDTWRARGTLTGEPVDFDRHQVGIEVKAATYAGLRVEERPDGVTLRCVLDL
ncbi:archease [Sphaerobacter thermophilus]|uniref:archease n=1 Tax=Sphaerobacter thermophilus TaxID=2057 RepID=UPI000DAF4D67|nr:MAG: hypothetical protein DIU58_15815 [Sphaerobacter thermophilus]